MKKDRIATLLVVLALLCAVLIILGLCIDAMSLTSFSSLIAMAVAWAGSAISGKEVAL